jgi:hypothetical protein
VRRTIVKFTISPFGGETIYLNGDTGVSSVFFVGKWLPQIEVEFSFLYAKMLNPRTDGFR